MAQYGRKDCDHVWRERIDGFEEYCTPAVCIKCGAFGCLCDVGRDKKRDKEFLLIFKVEGVRGDANINGKWKNPYINIP